MNRYLLILICFFFAIKGSSQILHSITLEDRVKESDLVVCGEVSDLYSFWDIHHRNIYTTYIIKVFTALEDERTPEVEVLIKGGIVDNIRHDVSNSVKLGKGDKGCFILKKTETGIEISDYLKGKYTLSGGRNGFFNLGNISDRYLDYQPSSDKEICEFLTRIKTLFVHNSDTDDIETKSNLAEHAITGISPVISTAGTGSILDIYGEGFGSVQGSGAIWFVSSNNPAYIFTSNGIEIILWSDTHIQLVIPSEAATGNVRVNIGGEFAVSPEILTIRYACSNNNSKPNILINTDQIGGYTWHLNDNLNANTQAGDIVRRSIEKWVCATQIPWQTGEITDATPGMDGLCTISFGTVEDGLGFTGSFSESIVTNSVISEWVIKEFDMVFRDDIDWCFNRENILPSQYDFETVVLHELAHAHLIDHVNDITDLMHAGISVQSIRNINSTNIECGMFILNRSLSFANENYETIILSDNSVPGVPDIISGSTIVCSGQNSVIYSVTPVPGVTSYIWNLPVGASGSSTTNSITVNFSSSASSGNIEVAGSNSCGTGNSSILAITVNEKPSTPNISLKDDILYSDATAGNQWYYQDAAIIGATNQEYSVTNDGNYYVIVTVSGCSSDPSNTINAVTTGIDPVYSEKIIRVYPNPVSDELIIELEGNSERITFEILNVAGQIVFRGYLVDKTTVPTTHFAPGVYLVRIGKGKTTSVIIIKEKFLQ